MWQCRKDILCWSYSLHEIISTKQANSIGERYPTRSMINALHYTSPRLLQSLSVASNSKLQHKKNCTKCSHWHFNWNFNNSTQLSILFHSARHVPSSDSKCFWRPPLSSFLHWISRRSFQDLIHYVRSSLALYQDKKLSMRSGDERSVSHFWFVSNCLFSRLSEVSERTRRKEHSWWKKFSLKYGASRWQAKWRIV